MGNILGKIFSAAGKDIINESGEIIDALSTSDEEKSKAKAKLTEIVMSNLNGVIAASRDVIITEMKGNLLQRSWRPLMMITFGFILVSKWFGYTDSSISEVLELKLMSIIELGLGGYVVGRTIEQTAKTVTKNVDLPFLRKKDRKDLA